jgi:acetoin utilization deacetylase AcuC-like enzyme
VGADALRPGQPEGAGSGLRRTRRRPLFGLGRLLGPLLGRGLAHDAAFVYAPPYRLELPGVAADPLRGERILTFLGAADLLGRQPVHVPEPATFQQLRRVHDEDYLDAVGRPGSLLPILGLDLPDPLPDRVLESQRAMAGGTLLAARLALAARGAAVNLGGGLHHAFADHGERFCLFNDVAVALAELRARGFEERVLVVDLDLHDGDGTRAILAGDPLTTTFSIHNRTNPAAPMGERGIAVELGSGVEDGTYLAALRERLPPLVAALRPGLAFYLAGCDPAGDDALGDWRISPAGMLERDRFVLDRLLAGERRVPTAVVLAGGYGQGAWRYSARAFAWLLTGRAVEPPSTEELTLARYRAVAARLAPHELTGDPARAPGKSAAGGAADDWGLSPEDFAPAGGLRARSRFLGYYSAQGLELTLERAGLLERLRQRGFDPRLGMDLDNPGGETLRLFGDRRRRELLIELRARIDRAAVPGLDLLRIEWLLLQNPHAAFTPERPPLPGQSHPGLGILPDVIALLVLACDRLRLDGIVFVPAYYHTAVQGRRLLGFLAPEHEGLFRALMAALAGLPLAEASRAVEEGRLYDAATGRPLGWQPMPMLLPVSPRAKERVGTEDYERRAAEAAAGWDIEVRPA